MAGNAARWLDHPQAETLLAGLKGVGHVIAADLGATAHVKANPGRTAKPAID